MSTESLLQKKVPLLYVLLAILITSISCYIAATVRHEPKEMALSATNTPRFDYGLPVTRVRLNDYRLIHPLLYGDREIEDSRLAGLKNKINDFIDAKRQQNMLINASVYFRNMNDAGWFAIDKDEPYTPASLQKVSIMMSWLKDVERNPSLMNKMIYFDKHFDNLPKQNIKVFVLQEHKSYAVKDLLHYMIAFSDNDALNLLYQNMNNSTYNKLFTDLELKVPNLESDDYTYTVKDYALFFRILYNATYLSHDLSEYALRLLTECTYTEGITKHFDGTVTVAHKFGERNFGTSKQLHEFAIVYVSNRPYLLGIMTRGYDNAQLSDVLSGISDIVYAEMNPPSSNPSVQRYFTSNETGRMEARPLKGFETP